MGRKLDLTGLTDGEAAHVLQVVQRDMKLRKKEEERLSELKQELDEEGSRCLLLSRQACFNQRCCIRCCSPFTFLLNPKRRCRDCSYNVCKACRVYSKRDKAWLCSACQKCRLVKTQSLEWFYTNVKERFKRFGSAKVLKTLYRKHLVEHSELSELTEGSACEESVWNEGSVCGSDSTFYRRTEEHSLAETLSVAMQVAEEAIDEAISKAEFDTSTQEQQNEARYLREHRGELIEELAKTIVQKIISRRNALAEMRVEYDDDWPSEHNIDLHHPHPHQSTCDQDSGSLKPNLWVKTKRSHSAFTLLDDGASVLGQDFPTALKKEGGSLAMTAWKSVDRLDNSVLKSPDGNWIALQSAQLSRPSLLTKRKSLVYSALERESGVVSAYERLGSDETKPEPDSSWGSVLQEIHRKMMDSDFSPHDFDSSIAPLMGHQVGRDDLFSDSEGNWTPNKPLLALLKRKVPAEIRKPSSARRTSIIDVNFNPKAEGVKEETAAEPETGKIRKSRKKRRSKKEPASSSSVSDLNSRDAHPLHPSDDGTPNTLTSEGTTPEPFDPDGDITGNGANQTQDFSSKLPQLAGGVCENPTREEEPDKEREGDNDGQRDRIRRGRPFKMDTYLEGGRTHEEEKEKDDEEMKYRIYQLVSQSSLTYFSSTEEELDRVGQNEGDWDREKDTEEEEQKTEQLTYRLCQLENRVRGTRFSSTEDELDKMSFDGEEGKREDLAVKLCRLANEVNAAQFSSTEDELDRVGRGEDEEEVMNEEALWKLQSDKTRLRDLVSLVRASQFSSTEDELDRVGENEGETEQEANERGIRSGSETEELWEGAESIGDFDLKMFEFREERKEQSSDGKISEDLFDSQTEMEDDETDAITGKRQLCDKKVEILKGDKSEERPEIPLKRRVEAERAEANGADERIDGKLLKEIKERERKSEMAARSDEEDAEFDKIISSMLMMSLEDMQAETMKDKDRENRRRKNKAESDREMEGGSREPGPVLDEGSESAVSERVGELFNQQETEDVTGGRENMEEERQLHLVKEKLADITKKETFKEAKLKSPESEDKNQDGRGDVTEREAAETQTDCQGTGEDGDQPEDHMDQNSSALQGGFLSPEEIHHRCSASSLCSITTEVLKVLNATEELLEGAEAQNQPRLPSVSLPPNTNRKKLEQQFWRLEENVYVAAGSVYSLEAELSNLEECARGICSSTSDMELNFLEEQVAAAAARVQHSELQISNISARIAALKNAGLNVDPQLRFTKTRSSPDTSATLDSSRHLRRRLPAPPVNEDKEA